jgi:tape measure domain-containing protein
MLNGIEFILKLTDQLAPAMKAAAAVTDSAAQRMKADFDGITSKSRMMSSSVDDLKRKLDDVNKVRFSTRIVSQFDDATKAARKLETQIERLSNKGKASSGFGGMGGLGGLLAGFGLFQAGKATIGQAATLEQQRISFGVMTGSQGTGDKLLGSLRNYANVTPYISSDVIKASQTLLQFGVDTDKIMPSIKTLGDVASGDADRLQSLSLAFAQTTSAGKLMGQDLLQYVNAGFNPLKEISKMTGISMANLRGQMEKGAISADMVAAAFQHATGPGGQFYQMTEKQSLTMAGRWSTLMDAAKLRLLAIGEALTPVVNSIIDLGAAITSNGPVLAGIAITLGVFAVAINGVSWATRIWAVAQGFLNAIMNMNPIIRIIGLIIILGTWIYVLAKKYDGWGQSISAVWEIIKSFVSMNIIAWKSFGETVWYYVQYGWLKFKSFVEWVGMAISNVAEGFSKLLTLDFKGAKQAFTREIITPASKELDELQKKHAESQKEYAKTMASEVGNIVAQYNKIGLKKKPEDAAKAGVDPVTANTATDPSLFKKLKANVDAGKDKADSINGGGTRPIMITIGKQIEKLEVHVMDAKEGVGEIEQMVREALRRVLYSVNGMANS